MLEHIIFISMHLPSYSVPEAGQKLVCSRLESLVKSKQVHLITFCNEREKPYLNMESYIKCASVKIFPISTKMRLINAMKHISSPLGIAARNDKRVHDYINELLSSFNISTFHTEYEQSITYIPDEYLPVSSVVLHDVMSQSVERFYENEKSRLKKIFYMHQSKLIKKWEKEHLTQLGKITVLNQKDADLVKLIPVDENKIEIDFPKVENSFYSVKRSKDNIQHGSILFWGAMNRKENEDAIIWFYENMLPGILKEVPSAKLYIVGANPSDTIKKLNSENIIVTGFVESPLKFFEMAQVSIVPLRYGAGIKIKVLEALASKIPVVSTTVGAEGIIDCDGLLYVVDDEKLFTAKVIEVLSEISRTV